MDIPRNGIVGSYDLMFIFLRNYQTVFRFIFPAAKHEGSHFSTCSPTFLLLFRLFNPTVVWQGGGIFPEEDASSTGLLGGLLGGAPAHPQRLLQTGAYAAQFGTVTHGPFDLNASTSQLSLQLKRREGKLPAPRLDSSLREASLSLRYRVRHLLVPGPLQGGTAQAALPRQTRPFGQLF